MMSKKQYFQVRVDIEAALELLREKNPDIAKYLEENIIYDDEKMTIKYIGDNRIFMKKIFS